MSDRPNIVEFLARELYGDAKDLVTGKTYRSVREALETPPPGPGNITINTPGRDIPVIGGAPGPEPTPSLPVPSLPAVAQQQLLDELQQQGIDPNVLAAQGRDAAPGLPLGPTQDRAMLDDMKLYGFTGEMTPNDLERRNKRIAEHNKELVGGSELFGGKSSEPQGDRIYRVPPAYVKYDPDREQMLRNRQSAFGDTSTVEPILGDEGKVIGFKYDVPELERREHRAKLGGRFPEARTINPLVHMQKGYSDIKMGVGQITGYEVSPTDFLSHFNPFNMFLEGEEKKKQKERSWGISKQTPEDVAEWSIVNDYYHSEDQPFGWQLLGDALPGLAFGAATPLVRMGTGMALRKGGEKLAKKTVQNQNRRLADKGNERLNPTATTTERVAAHDLALARQDAAGKAFRPDADEIRKSFKSYVDTGNVGQDKIDESLLKTAKGMINAGSGLERSAAIQGMMSGVGLGQTPGLVGAIGGGMTGYVLPIDPEVLEQMTAEDRDKLRFYNAMAGAGLGAFFDISTLGLSYPLQRKLTRMKRDELKGTTPHGVKLSAPVVHQQSGVAYEIANQTRSPSTTSLKSNVAKKITNDQENSILFSFNEMRSRMTGGNYQERPGTAIDSWLNQFHEDMLRSRRNMNAQYDLVKLDRTNVQGSRKQFQQLVDEIEQELSVNGLGTAEDVNRVIKLFRDNIKFLGGKPEKGKLLKGHYNANFLMNLHKALNQLFNTAHRSDNESLMNAIKPAKKMLKDYMLTSSNFRGLDHIDPVLGTTKFTKYFRAVDSASEHYERFFDEPLLRSYLNFRENLFQKANDKRPKTSADISRSLFGTRSLDKNEAPRFQAIQQLQRMYGTHPRLQEDLKSEAFANLMNVRVNDRTAFKKLYDSLNSFVSSGRFRRVYEAVFTEDEFQEIADLHDMLAKFVEPELPGHGPKTNITHANLDPSVLLLNLLPFVENRSQVARAGYDLFTPGKPIVGTGGWVPYFAASQNEEQPPHVPTVPELINKIFQYDPRSEAKMK